MAFQKSLWSEKPPFPTAPLVPPHQHHPHRLFVKLFSTRAWGQSEGLLLWGAAAHEQHCQPCVSQEPFGCSQHPGILSLCSVLLPLRLLQKPTSAPKENKPDFTTKYQERQFWQNHLSESHVKIGKVMIKLPSTLLERFNLNSTTLMTSGDIKKKKISIYSACCEEPLNKRITNPHYSKWYYQKGTIITSLPRQALCPSSACSNQPLILNLTELMLLFLRLTALNISLYNLPLRSTKKC